MTKQLVTVAIACALAASACTKVYNQRDRATTLTTPTPVAEPDVIEFRVLGNMNGTPVTIRHSNSLDGLTVAAGVSLPYYASIRSDDDTILLLLEASATPSATTLPTAPPLSVQVQIYVNGKVFRDAYATGTTAIFAQASGTFRR